MSKRSDDPPTRPDSDDELRQAIEAGQQLYAEVTNAKTLADYIDYDLGNRPWPGILAEWNNLEEMNNWENEWLVSYLDAMSAWIPVANGSQAFDRKLERENLDWAAMASLLVSAYGEMLKSGESFS